MRRAAANAGTLLAAALRICVLMRTFCNKWLTFKPFCATFAEKRIKSFQKEKFQKPLAFF